MTNVEGRKPEGAPERSPKAGEGAASGVDGKVAKRFSVQRKMAVVGRMLRGEPLELVARETNVSIAKLSEWRERALAGAATALKERERDDRDDEIARLNQGGRDHHGQRAALRQDRGAGGQTPFGPQEVETMSQALSPSFACCYGLARVARVWKISRASVYRSLKETPPNTSARRPGPVGACSDAELADHIRRQIDASRLHGEGYRKLWARLRFAGVRASPPRLRGVMRENGLLAPHRLGRTKAKPHDGTIITDRVNEMWGTDMTQTMTIRESRRNVFVAVEHANSEVIGIHECIAASEPSLPVWRVD